MTITEIKQQLEVLATKVSELETSKTGEFSFTREQLLKLLNKAVENTADGFIDDITRTSIDMDDYIDLDLNGREIELNIDESGILSEIAGNVSTYEFLDSDLDGLVSQVTE